MFHVYNELIPKLTFAETEHYGPGVSVSAIDFEANGTRPPFQSTYFAVKPGFTSGRDQHKVEEIWLVLEGNGVLDYDGEIVPIGKNDILHFAPYKSHQVSNNSSETLLICSIYW